MEKKFDQNLKKNQPKNKEKPNETDGSNFIAVRQIVLEIMVKNTFSLLNFRAASPLYVYSDQKTMGTVGKLVEN